MAKAKKSLTHNKDSYIWDFIFGIDTRFVLEALIIYIVLHMYIENMRL